MRSGFVAKQRLMNLGNLAGYARRKGYSVRTYVVAIAAVILIPLLLLGFWLVSQLAASERSLIERQAEQELQGITALVDHEITVAKSVLVSLASSQFLRAGDFRGFRAQAMQVSQQLGIHIVVYDPRRNLLVANTAIPGDRPVPGGQNAEVVVAAEQVLKTRQFAVSDLFLGGLSKRRAVSVLAPVIQDGEVPYILAAGISAARFAELIGQAQVPSEFVVTLIDGSNVVIARSPQHADFVGVKLDADLPDRAIGAGINRTTDHEGVAYQWHWRRTGGANWLVCVGIQQSLLDQPFRRWAAGYGIGAAALLVVAMWLAHRFGTRLSQSSGALGIDRAPTREEFRVLFDSASAGVVVVDGGGIMVLANARMEAQFGYSPGELIGRPVEILVPARNRNAHAGLRENYLRAPSPRGMGASRELVGLRKDGSEFPIEIGLNPIATLGGRAIMATIVDITARKQAEAELSAAIADRDRLRRRIIQAHEDERLRLAHDLHDETGQTLASALLELKNIEPVITGDGPERLRPLREQLHRIGKDLHRVAWQLRPASIDELGLQSALTDHVSEWSAQTAIDADFLCQDAALDGLPEDVRTTLYRVVQEGLTNIVKHAKSATSVSILIGRVDDVLRLTIVDDGCGFEQEQTAGGPRPGRGLGIAGMRERLALIGGELEIESSADGGTTVFARIPLRRETISA